MPQLPAKATSRRLTTMPPSLMSCPAEILSSAIKRCVVSYIAFRLVTFTSGLLSPSWLYTCRVQANAQYALPAVQQKLLLHACMVASKVPMQDSACCTGYEKEFAVYACTVSQQTAVQAEQKASRQAHALLISSMLAPTNAMHTDPWSVSPIVRCRPLSNVSALHCTSMRS